MLLLEAPVDYGRRQVAAALQRNWATGQATPLNYRLLNPLLWRWTAPQPAAELAARPAAVFEDYSELLRHPALGTWFVLTRKIYQAAERISQRRRRDHAARSGQRAAGFDRGSGEQCRSHGYPPRQLAGAGRMAALAGEHQAAEQAHATAELIVENPINQPLLAQVSLQGLRLAMMGIARGLRWDQIAATGLTHCATMSLEFPHAGRPRPMKT